MARLALAATNQKCPSHQPFMSTLPLSLAVKSPPTRSFPAGGGLSLPVRLRLVIAGSVPYRHCKSGCVSSLPAVTGKLADCKVDGCRRRALRAARAYAVHPSCRFLSRWVQLQCFKGSQWQGGAPIDFANLKKEHDLHR